MADPLFPIEIDLFQRLAKAISQRQRVGYYWPEVKEILIKPRRMKAAKLYEDDLLSFDVTVTMENGEIKEYEGLAF